VAVFAPGRSGRRLVGAAAQRGYDAASRGRGTEGWRAIGGGSADAEIAAAGATLRERMRDLVRNDPLAAKAVQVLVSNIVGTGIRPRAAGPDPAANRAADAVWNEWSRVADADGHTDFHGLTQLAVREMIEGGEVFARRFRRSLTDRLPVPLQIQLLEADHLDSARFDQRPDGSRIVQGIEYDSLGRRRAYWLFPDHPGDPSPIFGRRLESVRVDAANVAHLFERQRVQNRGVPWGVPAMRALRDLGDWHTSELTRKKIEASMVAFVFGADDDQQSLAPVVLDAEGKKVEQFEPGLIGYVRHGKDVKFNAPGSTSGIYEWNRVQQHIIAAGFRVPYELLTGDLSQVNFSSSRVGLSEFRRMVEAVQWHTVIPQFCEPIWRWVMEVAATMGRIPDPNIPAEWGPPKFESVNPLQDVQADILEVRAGFATVQQMIAKRGYDPEAILQEWSAFAALWDAAGLVFDTDPRRVTKGGQSQPPQSGVDEAPSQDG
jgi:lambda family phage portal protein